MTSADLRRGLRYDVQLPCQVHSLASAFEDLSGVTRNVSHSGLLMALEEGDSPAHMPKVGEPARIVMELPNATSDRRCVECLGRVVRVGQAPGNHCVAFEFRRFRFTEYSLVSSGAGWPDLV